MIECLEREVNLRFLELGLSEPRSLHKQAGTSEERGGKAHGIEGDSNGAESAPSFPRTPAPNFLPAVLLQNRLRGESVWLAVPVNLKVGLIQLTWRTVCLFLAGTFKYLKTLVILSNI